MTVKNFFLIEGIVCFLFGLPLLLDPSKVTDIYMTASEQFNSVSEVLGRGYGTVLIGLGVLFFSAMKATKSYGRRAILLGVTVSNILITLVHVYSITQGQENSTAWGTVILCTILTIWGGMLWNKETLENR